MTSKAQARSPLEAITDWTKITPRGRNVVLRRLPKEEKIGEIWLPDNRGEENLFCEVLKVSNGEWNRYYDSDGERHDVLVPAADVVAGDIVAMRQYEDQGARVLGQKLHREILVELGEKLEFKKVNTEFGLQALMQWCIVRRDPESETADDSRIIVPELSREAQDDRCFGTVLSAGPGWHDATGRWHQLEIKEGDRVVFPKWGGNRFEWKGETLTTHAQWDFWGIDLTDYGETEKK